jgi:two-component system sensor histidine kinase ChvG
LARRILAVNILTVLILALGVLSLDAFRNSLTRERMRRAEREAETSALAARAIAADRRAAALAEIGQATQSRIRVFAPDGRLLSDSWALTGPTYELRNPSTEGWAEDAARLIDLGFDRLVGAGGAPAFAEPMDDRLASWPEAADARKSNSVTSVLRRAPDLTPVLSAAAPLEGGALLVTSNERSLTNAIRRQRGALAVAMAISILISILLSLFLARTIVRPLRHIALAAHRVRMGRARQVRVPRLPSRRDEIGLLARSISDMSRSLRQRIDKIEAFAADVTHELKNPLASLRSALDGLGSVSDDKLRERLLEVARDDVVRLDRLIGDISEAARTDAELGRASFEPVDVGQVVEQLVDSWRSRRERGDAEVVYRPPTEPMPLVLGDTARLARAIDNVVDNAVSFSPPGGRVEIGLSRRRHAHVVTIDDEGPGVPPEARDAIFNRFHSIRSESGSSAVTRAWGWQSPRLLSTATTETSACTIATTRRPAPVSYFPCRSRSDCERPFAIG